MQKEDNLKMVIPEVEPLQKKQQLEESPVYQPCSEEKKVQLGNIKLQVGSLKNRQYKFYITQYQFSYILFSDRVFIVNCIILNLAYFEYIRG